MLKRPFPTVPGVGTFDLHFTMADAESSKSRLLGGTSEEKAADSAVQELVDKVRYNEQLLLIFYWLFYRSGVLWRKRRVGSSTGLWL